jgi:hypothetical protein
MKEKIQLIEELFCKYNEEFTKDKNDTYNFNDINRLEKSCFLEGRVKAVKECLKILKKEEIIEEKVFKFNSIEDANDFLLDLENYPHGQLFSINNIDYISKKFNISDFIRQYGLGSYYQIIRNIRELEENQLIIRV